MFIYLFIYYLFCLFFPWLTAVRISDLSQFYLLYLISLNFASIVLFFLIIHTILLSFSLLLPPLSTLLPFLHTMTLLWRGGIRARRRGWPGQLTSRNDAAGFYKKVLQAAESMLLLPSLSLSPRGFCSYSCSMQRPDIMERIHESVCLRRQSVSKYKSLQAVQRKRRKMSV